MGQVRSCEFKPCLRHFSFLQINSIDLRNFIIIYNCFIKSLIVTADSFGVNTCIPLPTEIFLPDFIHFSFSLINLMDLRSFINFCNFFIKILIVVADSFEINIRIPTEFCLPDYIHLEFSYNTEQPQEKHIHKIQMLEQKKVIKNISISKDCINEPIRWNTEQYRQSPNYFNGNH